MTKKNLMLYFREKQKIVKESIEQLATLEKIFEVEDIARNSLESLFRVHIDAEYFFDFFEPSECEISEEESYGFHLACGTIVAVVPQTDETKTRAFKEWRKEAVL